MLRPFWLGRLAIPVFVFLVLLAAFGTRPRSSADSYHDRRKTIIVQADTREPYVPDDPLEPIPFYTFSALLNHDYATKQGVDYIYLLHDAEEETGIHDENRPICKHPSEGWRSAAWCKVPAVWHMIQELPEHQYFIYIDSDAVFRDPALPLSRHLDHLTSFRRIGFLSNKPHNEDVCTGYFFLQRDAASLLADWWNVKAPSVNLQRLWEQDGLQELLKNGRSADEITLATPSYYDQIVFLANELQFLEVDPLQLVYHIPNGVPHRYESYLSQWRLDVPLDDRKALQTLLSRINFVSLNTSEVALDMVET